jgi:hypothetical protein
MKRTRSVEKAIDPGKPIRGIKLSAQQGNEPPVESNLSPERIVDGASVTTAVLDQILAQRQALHQLRNWGINE